MAKTQAVLNKKPKVSRQADGGGEAATPEASDSYFLKPSSKIEFIPSGSILLDCVLGGGWGGGRVANLVGDRAVGKSLLAIEACANFRRKFPDGKIVYSESESAFDTEYAEALGLPPDGIEFPENDTVEDVFKHINETLKEIGTEGRCLYIIDSLDALSDKAEQSQEIDKGTFGATKAKLLSRLFRQLIRRMKTANMTLLVVSQIRDNINAMFGEKHTRSGGKALDFYASQIIWLANLGQIKKTRSGVERSIGVKVKAKNKKNKIGLPYRDCEFQIIFGYGVEDLQSGLQWLAQTGNASKVDLSKTEADELSKNIKDKVTKMDNAEYKALLKRVRKAIKQAWREIEIDFLPTRKKY